MAAREKAFHADVVYLWYNPDLGVSYWLSWIRWQMECLSDDVSFNFDFSFSFVRAFVMQLKERKLGMSLKIGLKGLMLVRKWIFNILILGFLPTLAQAVSFSDLNFTPSSGDLSMTYLGLIFGSVSGAGLSGGTNQLIGQIFAVFNTGVLVMTMTIIGYTVFTTVVGVSQEGSGAFQTKIYRGLPCGL